MDKANGIHVTKQPFTTYGDNDNVNRIDTESHRSRDKAFMSSMCDSVSDE